MQLRPGSVVWLYVKDESIILRYFGDWVDLDESFRLKREKIFMDCMRVSEADISEETEEFRDAMYLKRRALRKRVGPFFYHNGEILANSIPIVLGEKRADKIDNPYSHERLYDDHFSEGDYIDVPRGRVVWDTEADRAIIYVDVCIEKADGAIARIADLFNLDDYISDNYIVEHDDHYVCPGCMGDIWEDD